MADTVAERLGGELISVRTADVGAARERARYRRLCTLALLLAIPFSFLWFRIIVGAPFNVFALPDLGPDWPIYLIPIFLIAALGATVAMPLLSGRSPHLRYEPDQIDVTLADVRGLDPVVDEVVKTLNTFLGFAVYKDLLGGSPRRGLLFEGLPGTGKTHLAKAMAREAGVPFFFVSATSFQSMWYGATARKIRSYFGALRKAALREGGAIGFIEEIDAIATSRRGLSSSETVTAAAAGCSHAAVTVSAAPASSPGPATVSRFASSEGTGGIVNELLVQMQSFDTPPRGDRMINALKAAVNAYLPAHRHLKPRPPRYANILLIAATNRADDLDPALLRPGRFDRRLTFELPAKSARRELVDHFLGRKAHAEELDDDTRREHLAGQTFGYTPVMIEHLLDEALVVALRNGRDAISWSDIQQARLTMTVGMPNPVEYTDVERLSVATHEAGHATVAWLAGTRRLEVLSIVKRSGSLGLLAHGDPEEVYTRTRKQMYALVDIALGGMCAEELFFGDAGTGPSSDLAYATATACEIVGAAGMAGSLVSLAAVQNGPLSDSNLVGRVLADPETRPEVDRILAQAKARVRSLLDANRGHVEALRDALLQSDELIGDEIAAVLETAGTPVRAGLHIERRGDRRRHDWLAPVAAPADAGQGQ